MNIKTTIRLSKRSNRFARFVLLLIFSLFTEHSAIAEVVELTINGYWSDKDVKVTDKLDKSFDPANPKFDGKVFSIPPAAGNLSLQLLVNTDGAIFFPKGSTFTTDGTGTYVLAHDFYGYKEVSLADDAYSFGTALWRSKGILTGLEGPDRVKAALWTDVDISKENPTRVSFRMFGKADGLTADLFVGSRTPSAIGRQFLLWEYYKGEEIRSLNYTAKTKISHP